MESNLQGITYWKLINPMSEVGAATARPPPLATIRLIDFPMPQKTRSAPVFTHRFRRRPKDINTDVLEAQSVLGLRIRMKSKLMIEPKLSPAKAFSCGARSAFKPRRKGLLENHAIAPSAASVCTAARR